jgi:contactin 2
VTTLIENPKSSADPPRITSEFAEKMLFLPGQPIRLECHAFGNPVPRVYWTKDNTVLAESNVLELLSNNTKHTSGNYTCVAENSEGTDTRCVEIQTVTPPKMKRDINESLKKVSINGVVDFVCPFDEYKQVTWFKVSARLEP